MKRKVRVIGIAESFVKADGKYPRKSLIAGVVMRGDLQIDGFAFTTVTINGLDATERIASMVLELRRPDIRAILLGGVVIALYNIVDLRELHEATGLPVIAVTYREGGELPRALKFQPKHAERLKIYERNGPRTPLLLKNGYTVYVRAIGIGSGEAKEILNTFTFHGRFPEPIRVAKLLARTLLSRIKELGDEIQDLLPSSGDESVG